MNRRSFGRRMKRMEGQEGPAGTGDGGVNVEYYMEEPDGALVRMPRPSDKDHVEGRRTIKVVFRYPKDHSNAGGEPVIESETEMAKRDIANPDRADALPPTFPCGVTPESVDTRPTYWRPPRGRMSRHSWLG
jgi:hypothetical protein